MTLLVHQMCFIKVGGQFLFNSVNSFSIQEEKHTILIPNVSHRASRCGISVYFLKLINGNGTDPYCSYYFICNIQCDTISNLNRPDTKLVRVVGQQLQETSDHPTEAEPPDDLPEESEHQCWPDSLPDQRHAAAVPALPLRGHPAAPNHLDQGRSRATTN